MKTFAERLNAAMAAADISQGQLASAIGISQPAIQKMTAGKTQGSKKILEIASTLGVSAEWLSSGTGQMRDDSTMQYDDDLEPFSAPARDDVFVPLLSDIEQIAGNHPAQSRVKLPRPLLRLAGAAAGDVICFVVSGNSMAPAIPEGSTAAINTLDKKITDGKLYVINQDEWMRLRILYRVGPNRVSIRSFNTSEFPDEESDLDKVEIVGRLFWTSTVW
jgi:phage repressor protein C with HTH and peptisase S24 domain